MYVFRWKDVEGMRLALELSISCLWGGLKKGLQQEPQEQRDATGKTVTEQFSKRTRSVQKLFSSNTAKMQGTNS